MKRVFFKLLANVFASSHFTLPKVRRLFLRMAGIDLLTNDVKPGCYFNTRDVSIGKETFINYQCKFFSSDKPGGQIIIGDNCFIGMNVLFTTMTHETGTAQKRAGEKRYYPIVIGDGCWLGTNATVLPGVKIGEGCVIAAGSVVHKDCEPNGLYAGVPARRIKDLD